MNKEVERFKKDLRRLFPHIIDAKINEGILVEPDIRKVLSDQQFEGLLQGAEIMVWNALKDVVPNILVNNKARNYVQLFEHMIKA